jgi:GNAT superfamily N-acetyltransferase
MIELLFATLFGAIVADALPVRRPRLRTGIRIETDRTDEYVNVHAYDGETQIGSLFLHRQWSSQMVPEARDLVERMRRHLGFEEEPPLAYVMADASLRADYTRQGIGLAMYLAAYDLAADDEALLVSHAAIRGFTSDKAAAVYERLSKRGAWVSHDDTWVTSHDGTEEPLYVVWPRKESGALVPRPDDGGAP